MDRASGGDGEPAAENVRLRRENDELHRAMTSRAVIDQARGMVMVLAPCSRELAMRVLVDLSQRSNVKLREVARALVATAEGQALSGALRGELRRELRRLRSGPL